MPKLLTPYEKAELWSQIDLVSNNLNIVARQQKVEIFYQLFDELQSLRNQLQNHHIAEAMANF